MRTVSSRTRTTFFQRLLYSFMVVRGWLSYKKGMEIKQNPSVIFAVLCCVLLPSCGGGGGVSIVPPPPSQPPALTEPERIELRGLAARAAAEIMEPPPLPKNLEEGFMAEIASLQSAIVSWQGTKTELQRQIEDLRIRVESKKNKVVELSCEIAEQVRNNGACEYLPCGAGMERINGKCQCSGATPRWEGNRCLPPLTVAECNNEDKILEGNECRSCTGTTPRREGNRCLSPLTVAECNNEDKILENNICRSCTGVTSRREGNRCLSPLTVAECNNEDKILENNLCRSCTGATPRREGNRCLPSLTVVECNNEDKILEGNECRSCMGATPRREENRCLSPPLTVADCNNQDKILYGNECRSCGSGFPRRGNRCLPPLTVAECNNEDKILEGNECRSCTGATPRREGNRCLSGVVCGDGSVHDDQQECEFRTAEYGYNSFALDRVGAIYAYQREYHGQEVTVANVESILASHEDLTENVLTMSISVRYKDYVNHVRPELADVYERYQKLIEYLERYDGDRFDENWVRFLVEERGRDVKSINGRDFHGTASAGVIAAARNGLGGHGVAPRVKIIPIPRPDVSTFRTHERVSDLQYILDKKIPIINHSVALGSRGRFSDFAVYGLVKDSDSIFVWSAGNVFGGSLNLKFPDDQLLPHHIPELEDNWLIAAGWNSDNTLYGSACGDARLWCIAAPASYPAVPDGSNNGYRWFGGTSASAPIVSGALAVLKSAAPTLPMTVIRSILLTTATDLGEPGIDDVFGWGGVNISAGIVLIENMQTPRMRQMSPVSYRALHGTLPPEFAHMKARFSAVEIAVNLTNGLYYNMPLSRMFSVAPGRVSQPLGDAALKLLSSPPVAEENPPSGFFAFGDIDGEIGVRWRGKTGAFGFLPSGANMLAEASHVVSDGALSGASFGALGTASGSSNGGKFRLGGRLLGGLSAFGEYEYRDISAGVSGALLDSRIRGAEASGWSAGLEYGFIGGGRMRISASRRTELSGGELVLRYPKAVGADLGDAFLGRGGQVLMEEETALPLSRRVPLLWSLGYAVSGSGKSEWSAALEYDEDADDGAISAAWRLEF